MPTPIVLSTFPTSCGVYLMKNQEEQILYIGKAKNLRTRISQYLGNAKDGRAMVPFLMAQVHSIETILVTSEKEALLLENNLIKKHKPKYNALLKDDKSYLSLMVNHKDKWPMIRIVRYKGRPPSDKLYFGPFTNGYAARQTLNLLRRLFPLRQCSDEELRSRSRPCLLYDIKHCLAPCVGKCTKEEYDQQVKPVIQFLRGSTSEVVETLYKRVEKLSEALQFEEAKSLLETIHAIEKTVEKQRVEKLGFGDYDAFGLFRQEDSLIVTQLMVREGKVIGLNDHFFEHNAQNDEEFLESFLLQNYARKENKITILTPFALENKIILQELIKKEILFPKKGAKQKIVEIARLNAKERFSQKVSQAESQQKLLSTIEEQLGLTNYPHTIECYDCSNISQTNPVSAKVVFEGAVPNKKKYRKYKLEHGDDYNGLREVLTRRLKSGQSEDRLPDLILIDGGRGQLKIAKEVLDAFNISSVDLVAISKEKGAHDKGLSAEKLYLDHPSTTAHLLELSSSSQTLLFLQRVRDEAHRFAIAYHKTRRKKSLITTKLLEIEGIGPQKSKKLLNHFGSIKQILAATDEELLSVKGISKKDIINIRKLTF